MVARTFSLVILTRLMEVPWMLNHLALKKLRLNLVILTLMSQLINLYRHKEGREEEYVGVNDESRYMTDQQDDQDAEPSDSDCYVHDDLYVDDEAGCDVSEHVT